MVPTMYPGSERQPMAGIRMQTQIKTIPKSKQFLFFCGQLYGMTECVCVCVCVCVCEFSHKSPVQPPLTLDVS